MKRFWTEASVRAEPDGHAILLDGKPMRLPGGAFVRIPGLALADAIAAEWQAAGNASGGTLSAADTPLTGLAGTAQLRIAPDPAATVAALAAYAESDLLCYRAEAPPTLAEREQAAWQPWLDWAERTYGARLRVTSGIRHVGQDAKALAALRAAVERLDPWVLAGMGVAVPSLGSLVLGLAVAQSALGPAEAHALASLDEAFQNEKWGEDAEAADRRRAVLDDLILAERFMALARAA